MKKCLVCKKYFDRLDIHHINCNHEDNRKENRIPVCKRCHGIIHNGLNKEKSPYKRFSETMEKIQLLRNFMIVCKFPNKRINRKKDVTALSNEINL